ncbi:MAG: 4Fe-4S binding protein [archaeon]|nr:4Fe-4S binding protein [archaeon]
MTVKVNESKCLHCGGCVGSCPKNAIFLNDFVLIFDDEKCSKCKRCVNLCPVTALSMEE